MTKTTKTTDWRIVIAAIAALVAIEGMALYHGINGKLLTVVIGIIAGLGGWALPQLKTN